MLTEATGHVQIDVPRDRDGSFEPQIVKKRQRRLTGVDEIVLSLYAKGLTTGEISAHFAEIYGVSVSKETISRITDRVLEEMTDWANRPLGGVYAAIFIDAIVVKFRDGQVGNRPISTAIGVSLAGEKDVLGLAERRSHDYIRHGTSTLFAALEIATGQVSGACKPRHRHQEFRAFLKQVARAYPDVELHLVMDNHAAHKHPAVKAWLAANPRITCHFTPTHASWMNLVEVWFSLIERQAIHRGSFGSVRDLNAKSAPSSPGGTTDATPSSGPRQPTRSSTKPTARRPQTQGVSY